jgi:hypothetical protein
MAVLASDSFNRAANASSLGTTDSYAGGTAKTWQQFGTGAYGIDASGKAYRSTAPGSGRNVAYLEASQSNGSVSAVISSVDASSYPKLCFRIVDEANMLYVEIENTTNQIDLRKYVGGTSSLIQSYTGTVTDGSTLKITANGSNITVYLNGVSIITAPDTFNQSATKWGFSSYAYPTVRFDNFIVEDLNTGTTYSGNGTAQGYSNVLFIDKNEIVAQATLIGVQRLEVTLKGKQKLDVNLKGVMK